MKIHAFRVVPRGLAALDNVIDHIIQTPIGKRMRTVLDTEMRLEEAVQYKSGYALDFSLMRYDGPGRGSRTNPVIDFALNPDEGFCEETAAYYDSSSGFITVQYNHRGVKARLIEGYFNQFSAKLCSANANNNLPQKAVGNGVQGSDAFTFAAVLKDDSLQRLMHKNIISSLEFSVSVPGIPPVNRGKSLSSVLNAPVVAGARQVSMKITAGRAKGATLDVKEIKDFISNTLNLGGDVTNLKAKGKDFVDGPTEALDFIAERLERDISIVPSMTSRRLDRNERWNAVSQAFSHWEQNKQLK